MSVPVTGLNGRPLMPTTERKARILLKEKKAKVICRHPFVIGLLYKTGCATQEGCLGVDTGSRHIGVAVTAGDRVVLKAEHTLRPSMVNILRKRLFREFPDAAFTYGNITAADRKQLMLPKTHANDAVAISLYGKDVQSVRDSCKVTHYIQVRKTNRQLHEATARKWDKTPNRNAERETKNVRCRSGIHLWDTVQAGKEKAYVCGFSGNSSIYLKNSDMGYIDRPGVKNPDKRYLLWDISNVKRLHPNGGWVMY